MTLLSIADLVKVLLGTNSKVYNPPLIGRIAKGGWFDTFLNSSPEATLLYMNQPAMQLTTNGQPVLVSNILDKSNRLI
jgi:hypothetical protein